MALARRRELRDALIGLDFPKSRANELVRDTPLEASLTDEDALMTLLRAAQGQAQGQPVTSSTPAATPDATPATAAHNAVAATQGAQPGTPPAVLPDAMPKKAEQVLQRQQLKDRPLYTVGSRVGSAFGGISDWLTARVVPWLDRLGNMPEPGGIMPLLIANLLFLAAIVPANSQGFTRLQLAWLTLLNQTALPEEPNVTQVPDSPIFVAVEQGAVALDDMAHAVGNVAGALGGLSKVPSDVFGGIASTAGGLGGILSGLPPWLTGAAGAIAGAAGSGGVGSMGNPAPVIPGQPLAATKVPARSGPPAPPKI